ncbi:2'-5' RNA ligase family protein [Pararhizobium sp.]|uniref:2'-5' RNA ligase family protein n=1 Tax=Pararhizobium sp. TaxID=1977563 RepID=UPI00271D6CBD|nr:2'-5' RNA ligase family protein [Pararhizobium sp.]MDO9417797.1 2'-5' RNA ligase family protein [Pararhizobium sp.]
MKPTPPQMPLDLFPRPGLLNQSCASRSRLYFALLPPGKIVADAARLSSNIRNVYHLAEPARPVEVLHVSLLMMSRLFQHMPQFMIDTALAVGDAVEAEGFGMSFDRAASVGKSGRAAIALFPKKGGSSGVQALRRQITEAALKRKLAAIRKETPHMTLVYSSTIVPDITLTPPFEWRAQEFALVQSFFGETRHEYLRRWPLSAKSDNSVLLA